MSKSVIRQNIWETNSSSMHSLQINNTHVSNYSGLRIDNDGYIHSEFGEFGWGYDEYYDPREKLSYALTMVAETEKYTSEDEFYHTAGFNAIENLIVDKLGCLGVIVDDADIYKTSWGVNHTGYIDHQSCEGYGSLQDFLNDYSITLEEFIFSDGVGLIIDNDNN